MSLLSLRTILAGGLLLVTAFSPVGALPVRVQKRSAYRTANVDSPVNPKSDRILGHWYFPKRESNIEIYRENGHYFAKILAVSEATAARFGAMDNKLLLTNLSFAKNEWSGGQLIHPQTGNRFDVFLTLSDDNTLVITAYKGCRLFNKAYILTRI